MFLLVAPSEQSLVNKNKKRLNKKQAENNHLSYTATKRPVAKQFEGTEKKQKEETHRKITEHHKKAQADKVCKHREQGKGDRYGVLVK